MSLEDKKKDKNQGIQFESLEKRASQLNSQIAAWIGERNTLRINVTTPEQAELDDLLSDFEDNVTATFGS